MYTADGGFDGGGPRTIYRFDVDDATSPIPLTTIGPGPERLSALAFASGAICPQPGACCLDDGMCVQSSVVGGADCAGVYQGDNTSCDSADCPQPGACCFDDGTCAQSVVLGGGDCAGAYQGDDTFCDTIGCPEPGRLLSGRRLVRAIRRAGRCGLRRRVPGRRDLLRDGRWRPDAVRGERRVRSSVDVVRARPGRWLHHRDDRPDGRRAHCLDRRASDHGVLYGVFNDFNDPIIGCRGALVTIDTTTAATTEIGETGYWVSDLTFDSSGTLFGMAVREAGTCALPRDLVTIDLTSGAATIVGDAGLSSGSMGLSFDGAGNLFLKSLDDLYSIDPGTGLPTFLRTLTPADFYDNILAYNPLTGLMYTSERDSFPARIYTFDPDDPTGTTTLIGTNTIERLAALAFTPGFVTCPQPGACCFDDGSCVQSTVLGGADCAGVYQGDDTDCADADCPQPGACCLSDGSCVLASVLGGADCAGDYQGDDTDCPDADCTQPGACCLFDGSCVLASELGGVGCDGDYQGDDTTCADVDCPANGACCLDDGKCFETTQGDCADANGAYQGNGVFCIDAFCPAVAGACCFIDGSCSYGTQTACIDAGGLYAGDGVACPNAGCGQPTGACCFGGGEIDSESCLEQTQSVCMDLGGIYQGDFTTCSPDPCPPPPGACCLIDGTCTFVTLERCDESGGSWFGPYFPCKIAKCAVPTGACCLLEIYQNGGGDPFCIEGFTQEDCSIQGGLYQGDFSTCEGVDCPYKFACCFEDGSCEALDPFECEAAGGIVDGALTCADVSCPQPTGACCEPLSSGGGDCIDVTQEECAVEGGIYQGDFTACLEVECPVQRGRAASPTARASPRRRTTVTASVASSRATASPVRWRIVCSRRARAASTTEAASSSDRIRARARWCTARRVHVLRGARLSAAEVRVLLRGWVMRRVHAGGLCGRRWRSAGRRDLFRRLVLQAACGVLPVRRLLPVRHPGVLRAVGWSVPGAGHDLRSEPVSATRRRLLLAGRQRGRVHRGHGSRVRRDRRRRVPGRRHRVLRVDLRSVSG